MEVLKSGLRIAAVGIVVAGLCAPQPAKAAQYELVISCQNVWRPNEKPAGQFESFSALRKGLDCTARLVAGWEAPGPESDRVGPGISVGGGPETDCANVHKERAKLQDRLDTLREELMEMNDLLANAGDIHTAAQNDVRRLQTDLAIEQASCNATTNALERLVNQAAAGRCHGTREEIRERCIDNLARTTPALAAAQTAATNACLFADGVDQDLNVALGLERDAEHTIRALWNRREDTHKELLRTQVRLQRMRDLEETCTSPEGD